MNDAVLLPLLTLIVQVFVIGMLSSFRLQNPGLVAFRWYLVAVTIWMVASLLNFMKLSPALTEINGRMAGFGWITYGVLFFIFIYRFLEKRIPLFLYLFALLAASAVYLSLFTDLIISGYEERPWGNETTKGTLFVPVTLAIVLLPQIISYVVLILAIRRSTYPPQKNQLRLILTGSFLGLFIAFTSDVILPYLLNLPGGWQIGAGATLIPTIFTVYALNKYREITIDILDASQKLFHELSDGVIITDRNGLISQANEMALSLLGANKDEMMRKTLYDCFRDYHPQRSYQGAILKTRTGMDTDVTITPIVSQSTTIGNLIILKDLRDKRALERDLLETLRIANNAIDAKNRFFWNVSHELRTPLNVLLGVLEEFRDEELREEKRNMFTRALNAGNSLRSMIDDLLDITQIEKKEMALDKKAIPLREILLSATDLHSISAKRKGLVYRIDISDDIPERIEADANRIFQIINNLLSNAVKFTKQGHVTFTARTRQEKSVLFLELEIMDTGIGIEKEQLHDIMLSFSAVDDSTTKSHSGLGLGLYIVRSIVELMNGLVSVQSEPGQGTRVNVRLPILYEKRHENPEYRELIKRNTGKILLVDDSEDNRLLMRSFLKKYPVVVVEAVDGKDAVEKFTAEPASYSLVLMDMQMPVMDGYTATEEIRSFEKQKSLPETPIVALTAYAMDADRKRALEVGCNEHITKPVRKADILSRIDYYTGMIARASIES